MSDDRIYAVGDVHGHLDKLREAHRRITLDCVEAGGPAPVVHVGDLVDRGPDSRGVIDFLKGGLARDEDWIVIRGNHDQLLVDFVRGSDGSSDMLRDGLTWLHDRMGGARTLESYGAKKRTLETRATFHRRAREAVLSDHVAFIEALPLWYRAKGMIFVHAGIRPGFPMEAQDEADLLWIRDEFLWHLNDHEALVVHGHTPVDAPTHYGNRVNIDTGAGWGKELVPVVFDGGVCFALTPEGREPVKAPRFGMRVRPE
ncbi:MAG: metallophosphoesterase [Pseudomonadota bacterium]